MEKADFDALYGRYSRDVFRFALYLSGQRAHAEDVTAETFLRAWSGLERIRTETVKAYLFSIARNLVNESRRRAPLSSDGLETLADATPGPVARAESRLELAAVMRALQSLRESDRAALLMRVQDGMAHEEIARVLGLSVTAVKVKIHRARLQLDELRIHAERLP
jgi:RNA polymerase sigma-70 factor (ECF subfamily)